MEDFLLLKLHGPMQAWGEHTFEGLRPSANIPSRSGVLGLLGACLGFMRSEHQPLQQLAESVGMAVRVDTRRITRPDGTTRTLRMEKATDYHTVKDARENYAGLKAHETIQTWREYLYDAEFTVALWNRGKPLVNLDELERAVKAPKFTPYLGRRSCPIARPLFETRLSSESVLEAFNSVAPQGGPVYSETPIGDRMVRVRDVPLPHQPRQFAGRNLYVYGGDHVSE